MKQLNTTSKSEKNKQENSPIFLYTIFDYDGADSNLYFAAWDADVTFNGQVYTRFPLQHDVVSENIQNQIDSVKVTVANVNRTIQGYLEQYDLSGKRVDIKMVWSNQLGDSNAHITDTYYIDSYIATEQTVEFTLTTSFDLLEVELPQRKYTRSYCQWKFKSSECGYSGEESACNKTKQRCKELSNYSRFGGTPSVPQGRVVVG